MKKLDNIVYVVEDVTTNLVPSGVSDLHVIGASDSVIHLQETLGEMSFPVQAESPSSQEIPPNSISSGIVIMPIEGGGPGKIFSGAEEISLAVLLNLLNSALSEDELNASLNTRLDGFDTSLISLSDSISTIENDLTIGLIGKASNASVSDLSLSLIVAADTADEALSAATQNALDIIVAQATADQNITDIDSAVSRVSQNEADIISLQNSVSSLPATGEDVTNLQNAYISLDGRVTTVENIQTAINLDIIDIDEALILVSDASTAATSLVENLEIEVGGYTTVIQNTTDSIAVVEAALILIEAAMLGGTTGQVLSKLSNNDLDLIWIDPPAGTGGGDYIPALFSAEVTKTGQVITAQTLITFDTLGHSDKTGLGVVPSDNPFTIPPDCDRAIISGSTNCGATFQTNLFISIVGSTSGSLAYDNFGISSDLLRASISSGPVKVVPGETINMTVQATNPTTVDAKLRIVCWNSQAPSTNETVISIPEVTEKESFTPNMGLTTNVTWTGQKWRIGNILHMDIYGAFTGVPTGFGLLTLPDSLEVDLSYILLAGDADNLGMGGIRNGATYQLNAVHNSTDATQVRILAQNTSVEYIKGATLSPSIPIPIDSGDVVALRLQVPISGWDTAKTILIGNESSLVNIVAVPEVSEKEAFTPNMSWATNVTWTGQKWRTGNMLYMEIRGIFSGAADSGNLTLTLPDSLEMEDTYKRVMGICTMAHVGSWPLPLYFYTLTATELTCRFFDDTPTTLKNISNTDPVSINNTSIITCTIAIPILGWNASKNINITGAVDNYVQSKSHTATISIDCSAGGVVDITMEGDATIDLTGGVDGQVIMMRIRQDATGSRIVTWGTMCRGSVDLDLPVLSTDADSLDYIGFRYNLIDDKYDCLAINKGF